jgi:hypothetical protein
VLQKHKLSPRAVRRPCHACDVTVERLLPADALRPRWSSANALVYIGGFVALFATAALLGILENDHGTGALVGYSLLATAVAIVLALGLQERNRPVAAGVLATLAVVFFAVAVGALEVWIGILDDNPTGGDWQPALLLVELLTIAAALAALRRFRAPLLVLPIATAFAVAVIDLGAEAYTAILAGLVLIAAGHAIDRAGLRPYGMWPHLVGGATFGGGVLDLVGGDAGWTLVGLLSIAYVAGAYAVGRSSYAVLGAIGILTTTTYFIEDGLSFVGFFVPVSVGDPGGGYDPWQIAMYYIAAGLLILGLGLLGDRFARLHRGDPEA